MTLEFKNRADANKSFVKNYHDHLSFFYKSRNGTNIPSPIVDDGLLHMPIPLKPIVIPFGRFNVHKSLHDRYDYVDKIIGATIAPIACVLASVYLFTKAGGNLLTLASFTDEPYFKATIGNFCYSILALGMAAYCFVKSIVSLLIRPLITLNGYDTSEEDRFCTGINDRWDFDRNASGLYEFSRIPTNIYQIDYNSNIEFEWHKNIRPMLGFGNN
jgi:hypothetical protein